MQSAQSLEKPRKAPMRGVCGRCYAYTPRKGGKYLPNVVTLLRPGVSAAGVVGVVG